MPPSSISVYNGTIGGPDDARIMADRSITDRRLFSRSYARAAPFDHIREGSDGGNGRIRLREQIFVEILR